MDYICSLCNNEFMDIKICISHLKQAHLIIDNTRSMECIVNVRGGKKCGKSYNTFNGLRNHAKKCIQNRGGRYDTTAQQRPTVSLRGSYDMIHFLIKKMMESNLDRLATNQYHKATPRAKIGTFSCCYHTTIATLIK